MKPFKPLLIKPPQGTPKDTLRKPLEAEGTRVPETDDFAIDFSFEDADFGDEADFYDFEDEDETSGNFAQIDARTSTPQKAAEVFDKSIFADLTEEEMSAIDVIKTYEKNAIATFVDAFFQSVKDEYAISGVAVRNYVLQFRTPEGAGRVDDFKRTFTVRVSRVRKEATKQLGPMPKFWVTFVKILPVAPADGRSKHWLVSIARMNEAQYSGFARERARQQREGDSANKLMQSTIGAL